MDLQKYSVFVPVEIDDIIQDEDGNEYQILDITHTYSAFQRTIIKVDLELKNLSSEEKIIMPYKSHTWKIVRYVNEEEENNNAI